MEPKQQRKKKRNPVVVLPGQGKRSLSKANPAKAVVKPKGPIRRPIGDIRTVRDSLATLQPSNQQQAIPIEVNLDPFVVYGVCLSYVDSAVARGFLSRASSPDVPYYASVYMVNVLLAYIKGTTPKATALPLWLQEFGQALSPKRVPMGTGGLAAYRFIVSISTDPFVPFANQTIGSPVYGYEHLLWIPTNAAPIDGFPIAGAPGGYTDEKGLDAWSAVANFMQSTRRASTQICPLKTTAWSNSVSAFAMPTIPEGLGFGGSAVSGGRLFMSGLEVPVRTPHLGVFANFLLDGSVAPARYGRFSQSSAGDSLWASQWFHSVTPSKSISTKRPTMFHFVDFLEFGDVAALWCTFLNFQAIQDASFATTLSAPSDLTCPLSLQEFLLCVRNDMMVLYGSTQPGCQSIYPRSPDAMIDNEFVPFLTSTNCVGLASCGIKLPQMLVENMKALIGRTVHFGRHSNDQFFCPVLGQYASDALSSSNYEVTFNGDPVPTFATLSDVVRVRRRSVGSKDKDKSEFEPFVEATIAFVDGTSGGNYVFQNDTTRLRDLAAMFNEWAARRQTYSSPLSAISKDMGVNICSSVGTTRHWIPTPDSYRRRMADMVDTRIVKRKGLSATHYASRMAVGFSARGQILSPVFEQIQSMWILPVNKAVAGPSTAAQSLFLRESIMLEETASISTATVETGQTMAALHETYALAMTHGLMATTSELDTFFIEQAKNGKAGVLSGLVAGFLGKAFGPTVGSIAGAVADIVPI
jgi:hypothetical protein